VRYSGAQEHTVATSVLFICLGNICRSPLAEGIFRHLAAPAISDFQIDSAGTGDWHLGEPPHAGSRAVARAHGIDMTGQVSRQVRPEELQDWDWIIAMDSSNQSNLLRMGADPARVRMLLEFAGEDAPSDVPDPYYEGGFERVYDLVHEGCSGLLEWLEGRR
jgi:protein-tyrosine phosphatase